jgi:hypothetical protein
MPRLSAAAADLMLQALFAPGTTYNLALFVTDPGTTGGAGEVSGGSYSRQPIVFTAAVAGAQSNNAGITFAGMPAVTSVPYMAVYTTGGTFLAGGASGFAGSVGAGGSIFFPTGAVQSLQF